MFWKSKRKEPFALKSLNPKQRANLIRCLRDEFKDLLEDTRELDNLH